MGIHSSTHYRGKRQLDRHGPEILTRSPLPQCAATQDRAGGDALSHPPPRSSTWPRPIHARHRALVFVGAYGSLPIGELAGLRQSRVDLRAGAIAVAEILSEVKGKLIAGPPKTRASRRTVGLPPFVVRELEAHLAAAERPGSHVFTPWWGTAAGPGLSGALLGAAYQGSRPARPAHPRSSPHPRGAVDYRRRNAQGGRAVRRARLGQLHPGPLRPPEDPLAGRGGPVPSSKGLDYAVRQHGRKPQDVRSPG
jgi:integrase